MKFVMYFCWPNWLRFFLTISVGETQICTYGDPCLPAVFSLHHLVSLIMLPPELITGGGMMGNLIRKHSWENTDLGPISQWSPNLLNAISIMLSSRYFSPLCTPLFSPNYITIYTIT